MGYSGFYKLGPYGMDSGYKSLNKRAEELEDKARKLPPRRDARNTKLVEVALFRQNGTEVRGGGYKRIEAYVTANQVNEITWPVATGNWGTLTSYRILDLHSKKIIKSGMMNPMLVYSGNEVTISLILNVHDLFPSRKKSKIKKLEKELQQVESTSTPKINKSEFYYTPEAPAPQIPAMLQGILGRKTIPVPAAKPVSDPLAGIIDEVITREVIMHMVEEADPLTKETLMRCFGMEEPNV